MPTWTTHKEGGSWSGGGTDVPDCSEGRRNDITAAFDDFVNDGCLDCFPGLEDCLRDKWATVEIDCTGSDCDGRDGRTVGNKIYICVDSRPRIDAVLLHELVHLCGGDELDAEAAEWACFNGNGATAPGGDDWDKFRSETGELDGNEKERVGEFVIWNSDTGEVWGKTTTGGGWGGGDPAKGDRCFQSDDWDHDYGSGGGW